VLVGPVYKEITYLWTRAVLVGPVCKEITYLWTRAVHHAVITLEL
jgi:hypothetical protein